MPASSPIKQSPSSRHHRSKSCITKKRIQKSSKINLKNLADGLQDVAFQIHRQKELLKSPVKRPPSHKTPRKSSTDSTEKMPPKSPAKRKLFQDNDELNLFFADTKLIKNK